MQNNATGPTPSEQAADPADPADLAAGEVFFDGGCPLCRREIALYQQIAEDQVNWRDVDAGDGAATGKSREQLLARFHVRRRNGELISGFPAFMAVWRAIPQLAWAGWLFDRQPFHWLGDRAYALFLWVRPLWRPARKPDA